MAIISACLLLEVVLSGDCCGSARPSLIGIIPSATEDARLLELGKRVSLAKCAFFISAFAVLIHLFLSQIIPVASCERTFGCRGYWSDLSVRPRSSRNQFQRSISSVQKLRGFQVGLAFL